MPDDKKTKESAPTNEEVSSAEAAGSETTDTADAVDAGSELLARLDKVTAEANQHRDRYLRAMAEMDTIRRRGVKDKEESRKFGALPLIDELLPVLDNFRHGLDAAKNHEGGKAFAEGFSMILVQLQQVLTQNGVTEICPEGEDFDPNFHESVGAVPSDEVEEGKVIEVQRTGYRLHDRLLRAAIVTVSKGPAK